jgi:Fe-S-cluster containining protein
MNRDDDNPRELAQHWRGAAAREDIRDALLRVYAVVASEVRARGPACWASGRCCNFDRAGHRLYVTGLEAAFCVVNATAAPSEPATAPARAPVSLPVLTIASVDASRERGDCPFLANNLCTAHAMKPLGCRIYFCDRSAQRWQEDLSERALADIRAIHDRFAIPYRYAEWRTMLAHLAES